jgi:hypothetical protein
MVKEICRAGGSFCRKNAFWIVWEVAGETKVKIFYFCIRKINYKKTRL